jgi:exodeoxyribonuclease V beta subunit
MSSIAGAGDTAVRVRMPSALAGMPIRCHHVIEASAGTGKTYLIEHRIVDLLLRGDVTLEQLLVVTFTEKATAELSRRLRQLLARLLACRADTAAADEPHWRIDGPARQMLSRALQQFDAAAIHTIHGFCHRVLADGAFAAGRLLEQSQVATRTAFGDAFRGALRTSLARLPCYQDHLVAWLEHRGNPLDLEQLLFDCAVRGGRLAPVFEPEALRSAIAELRPLLAELLAGGASIERTLKDAGVHASTARAAERRLGELAALLAAQRDGDALPHILAGLQAGSKDGPLDYLVEKLAGLRGGDCRLPLLHRKLAAVRACAVPLDSAVAQLFLPVVQERLARDKHDHGLFDFQDMLDLVWQALASPGGGELARQLRRRYPFALIDEFQDTDETQWQIFRRLYLDGEHAHLTLVGDPKQAIYGFRGADVHTYLRARSELLARGGQLTELTDNYRSTPQVVAAYNLLLSQGRDAGAVLDRPFFTGAIRYERPVRCATRLTAVDPQGRCAPAVHVFTIGQRLPADDCRRLLASRITAEIRTLLAGETLRFGEEGGLRPVRPSDIFVLTRSFSECDEMARHLRAAGIPCALFQNQGLLQSSEARDVCDLLAGIANLRDRSARFRAWQTRFFGVELADLPRLADLPDDHPLLARLLEWKGLAERRDYEQLFADILARSRIIERELFLGSSERAISNFEHIFELLLADVVHSRCELHELCGRLRRWMSDTEGSEVDERNVQRLESHGHAVQLMTMHKSKGLEAPIVFLYGGFSRGQRDRAHTVHEGGERRLYLSPLPAAQQSAARDEAASEDQRLLYVALTRASARLYLPHIAELRDGCQAQLAPRLERVMAAIRDPRHAPALAPLFTFEPLAPDSDRAGQPGGDPLDLTGYTPPAELLAEPDEAQEDRLLPGLAGRSGRRVTSYSKLHRDSEAAAGPPAIAGSAAPGETAAAAPGALPGGARTGIFLHDLLEHLPWTSAARSPELAAWRREPEVALLFDEMCRRHQIPAAARPEAELLIHSALTVPIPLPAGGSIPGLCQVKRLLREMEFLYPAAAPPGGDGATYVRGFIDLVFEHDDRIYLLDWKSDLLADYDPDTLRQHCALHYREQALLYGAAIDRLLRSGGQARGRGGMLYLFLRGVDASRPGRGIHFFAPGDGDLDAELAALAGGGAP